MQAVAEESRLAEDSRAEPWTKGARSNFPLGRDLLAGSAMSCLASGVDDEPWG